MKLLPLLLLAFVISMGVACSSEPAEATTRCPNLRRGRGCRPCPRDVAVIPGRILQPIGQYGDFDTAYVKYRGEGKWEVVIRYRTIETAWYVYEGSNAIEKIEGRC